MFPGLIQCFSYFGHVIHLRLKYVLSVLTQMLIRNLIKNPSTSGNVLRKTTYLIFSKIVYLKNTAGLDEQYSANLFSTLVLQFCIPIHLSEPAVIYLLNTYSRI